MNPSRASAGAGRRWQVPASIHDAKLPQGFRPLLLRLPSQEIELELRQPDILVGRHTLVDLCLPYPDISRKHCRIVFADDCWHIVDVGSLNGIEVNGERKREADLREGDTLRIAGLRFEVHVEAGESFGSVGSRASDSEPILHQIATTLSSRGQEQLGATRKAS
jgi:pSer/pThr/pTyr-binding forkhead associated (FHA) protein